MKSLQAFWARYQVFFFFLAVSFLLVAVCSMSSFLFPIHTRVDQNVFFTVGREILHGKVPYRDLFEHKGPLTYFLHAGAALISDTSFLGVYLLEVAFFSVFLYYLYKIAGLFLENRYALFASLLSGIVVLTTYSFLRGDNVEQFTLTFWAISMYYFLRQYIRGETETGSGRNVFLNGILVGCILWIKFNLLGFWVAWALFTYLPLLVHREWRRFFRYVGLFLLGILLTTIPWVIYFTLNGAMGDFLYTYFYCNIFLYSKDISFLDRLDTLWVGFVKNLGLNPLMSFLIGLGLVHFTRKNRFIWNKTGRWTLLGTFVVLYMGVFFGGRWYDYYVLICAGYVIFGVIALMRWLVEGKILRLYDMSRLLFRRLAVVSAFGALGVCILFGNCLPYMGRDKMEYPQFCFAEYINQVEDATLLNYGFIDGGFYLAAQVRPVNKYFCKVNIDQSQLPEMYEEQLSMLENREVDFVIVRMYGAKRDPMNYKCPALFENYYWVATEREYTDNYVYGLFAKRPET